jgi:putative flippase GtrA
MNYITDLLRRKPIIVQILRFAAIGSLNTALDFLILNFITKSFNVTSGITLGEINIIGFSAAVVQSYFWNKGWAFAESKGISIFQNAIRLVLVGGLGALAVILVLLGASKDALSLYYLILLIAFIVIEFSLWMGFGLRMEGGNGSSQFVRFIVVSLIGLLINSAIIVLATKVITPYLEFSINADIIKNVAKILATGVSLIWNFIGYKLIVFKK